MRINLYIVSKLRHAIDQSAGFPSFSAAFSPASSATTPPRTTVRHRYSRTAARAPSPGRSGGRCGDETRPPKQHHSGEKVPLLSADPSPVARPPCPAFEIWATLLHCPIHVHSLILQCRSLERRPLRRSSSLRLLRLILLANPTFAKVGTTSARREAVNDDPPSNGSEPSVGFSVTDGIVPAVRAPFPDEGATTGGGRCRVVAISRTRRRPS